MKRRRRLSKRSGQSNCKTLDNYQTKAQRKSLRNKFTY